jgi:hypothetical protein
MSKGGIASLNLFYEWVEYIHSSFVSGCWSLGTGCRMLVIGYQLVVTIFLLQDYIDFIRGCKPLPQLTYNN